MKIGSALLCFTASTLVALTSAAAKEAPVGYLDEESGKKPTDSCVSLWVYIDQKCTGKPIRALTFPTYSEDGSSCYHDATMNGYSVSNQYCNMKTGNWHEKVFMGSDDCTKPWWYFWGDDAGFDLTFTPDTCIGGMTLKGCMEGPCPGYPGYEDSIKEKKMAWEKEKKKEKAEEFMIEKGDPEEEKDEYFSEEEAMDKFDSEEEYIEREEEGDE